jgi:hypothetical protein
MALYQLTTEGGVLRSDGAFIPLDQANTDYQAFILWVAAGNTPDSPPVPPKPTSLTTGDFVSRFTQAEQIAVQTACLGNAQLTWGLTLGLALGTIDLNGATLAAWMAGLVTAGAITSARSTAIMTP